MFLLLLTLAIVASAAGAWFAQRWWCWIVGFLICLPIVIWGSQELQFDPPAHRAALGGPGLGTSYLQMQVMFGVAAAIVTAVSAFLAPLLLYLSERVLVGTCRLLGFTGIKIPLERPQPDQPRESVHYRKSDEKGA